MGHENSGIDVVDLENDESGEKALADELQSARGKLERTTPDGSWEIASKIVTRYRPVPWILWRVIHAVLGKPGQTPKPDPITFDIVRPLIFNAAKDKTLFVPDPAAPPLAKLEHIIPSLGADVGAALCVIHGVCRRISNSLSERVWRPILDDALMRGQLGYHVGKHCPKFGPGRGMLAGFSGRSGLAVLIASGDVQQAQRALEGLAAGSDIRDVGTSVYGCDPLQVAAMTLSAAGCNIEAAFGTAAFSTRGRDLAPRGEQYLWLSAFAVCENIRMGTPDRIEERYWEALGYNVAARGELRERSRMLQRKGPAWQWLIESQVMKSS